MKANITARILVITIAMLGFTFGSKAQMTAYANIYAEVVEPAGVEKSADLTFTNITTTSASNIVLNSNGTGTLATFNVAGGNLATFDVSVTTESLSVSNMVASNFTSTTTTANALETPTSTVKIGATLYVPENQAPGSYDATNPFLVTLNYN